MDIITQTDPRINELIELAQEEGRPLALSPQTICALEDAGYLADPFTGMIWRDPAAPLAMTAPPALLRAMQDLIELRVPA